MTYQIPTPRAGEELVQVLVEVEHDRVRRQPGTETQFFVIDVHGAASLERAEAVVRGDEVLIAAQQFAQAVNVRPSMTTVALPQAAQPAFEGPDAVTLADVADAVAGSETSLVIKADAPLFDPASTLAMLAEVQDHAMQLGASLELAHADLRARGAELDQAKAQIAELQASQAEGGAGGAANADAGTGDGAGGSPDAAGDTGGSVAATGDEAAANQVKPADTPAKKTAAAKKAATKAK